MVAVPAMLARLVAAVLLVLSASGPGRGTTWGIIPVHSTAESMAGVGALGDGHAWVPQADMILRPVDVASLGRECRLCGDALLDEERYTVLNGQIRDAARGWSAGAMLHRHERLDL